jgi:hypothetical protein
VDLRLHHDPHHGVHSPGGSRAATTDLRPSDEIQVLRCNIALAA